MMRCRLNYMPIPLKNVYIYIKDEIIPFLPPKLSVTEDGQTRSINIIFIIFLAYPTTYSNSYNGDTSP